MLAAPHAGIYDAVLLVVGATLFFVYALDESLSWGTLAVPVGAWMIQFGNPPDVFRIGLLSPILTSLLIATAISGIRAGPASVQDSVQAVRGSQVTANGG
jgi:hypothetical protein